MVEKLSGAGAEIVELSLPTFEIALSAYYLIAPAECSANLARFDGIRYGHRAVGATTEELMARTRAEGFGPEVVRRILLGTYALSAGYYDAFYGQAQRVRAAIQEDFGRAYRDVDVLVSPTSPTVAFKAGDRVDDPMAMYLSDICTIPSNLSGHPAISVPIGVDDQTLPDWFSGDGPRPRRTGDVRGGGRSRASRRIRSQTRTRRGGAMKYEPVIGIEVHVELETKSKMFCGCAAEFGSEPNTNICPVCLGLPGALPVPNRQAIEWIMAIGLALNCEVSERSVFHRKNYFYADLPKNYQISQFDVPVCHDGHLDVEVDGASRRIGIERAHMEEDTGKSTHVGDGGRIHAAESTLLDFNRAGVPLVEIVSKPDVRSAAEARAYAQSLRSVVAELGVSDARLEEGSIRFDANVSVRPVGQSEFGTKVEIKNMNSFRSLERAVDYEIERQTRVIDTGGEIVQETRHWDEEADVTQSMRTKEGSSDYRYFTEPDLAPMAMSKEWISEVRSGLPELPAARRRRYVDAGLEPDLAGVLSDSQSGVRTLFDEAVAEGAPAKAAALWLTGEVTAWLRRSDDEMTAIPLDGSALAELVAIVDEGLVSSSAAKDVLEGVLGVKAVPERSPRCGT